MLSFPAAREVAERLLAAADAELERSRPEPLPEVPPLRPSSATAALRTLLAEARPFVSGGFSELAVARAPRILRPLARALLLPLRYFNRPQRDLNSRVLACLEALCSHLEGEKKESR